VACSVVQFSRCFGGMSCFDYQGRKLGGGKKFVLLFDSEYGGMKLFRNVGELLEYILRQPRNSILHSQFMLFTLIQEFDATLRGNSVTDCHMKLIYRFPVSKFPTTICS
jgi:hypothetical protein